MSMHLFCLATVCCTPFRYGLETLSQLFFGQSCLPYPFVYIEDEPSFRHRGLMLDVGLGALSIDTFIHVDIMLGDV